MLQFLNQIQNSNENKRIEMCVKTQPLAAKKALNIYMSPKN